MLIRIIAPDVTNSIAVYINPTLPSRVVYLSYRADRIDASDRVETLHIRRGSVLLRTPHSYEISVRHYEGECGEVASIIENTVEAALWMQTSATDDREALFKLGRTKIAIDKRLHTIAIAAPVGYNITKDPNQYGSGM